MQFKKNTSEINTQVAQSVSTKIKVLLGLVMGFAIVGMFGIVGIASENIMDFKKISSENILTQKLEVKNSKNQDIENYLNQNEHTMNLFSNRAENIELDLETIQRNIQEKGALWTADENDISRLSKEQKEKLAGLKITDEELEEIEQRQRNRSDEGNLRDGELPDFFDWRDRHGGLDYITSVKNQGACGSCWAFATLGMLEGEASAYHNNPNLNINLSEQDLISCFEPDGCNGLWDYEFPELLSYLMNAGDCIEECFPYTECDAMGYGNCLNEGISCSDKCSNWEDDSWGITNYEEVALGDVNALKQAIVEQGPVLSGMRIYQDFYNYDEGVYQHTTENISGYHAVLIVGFGVYDGIDYWIVKNSWGEDWGEDGYFRIKMGDSWIGNWILYVIDEPVSSSPEDRICADTDGDGYCNWGLGNMPSTCTSTCVVDILDCDDSNGSVFENCGENTEPTGFLSIETEPSDAEVYIRDLNSDDWIYRGNTPLEIELNVGEREIRVSKMIYYDSFDTVNIEESFIEESFINLEQIPGTNFFSYSNLSSAFGQIILNDVDNDGNQEIIMSSYNGNVLAFKEDGSQALDWPLVTDDIAEMTSAVADIDNDGIQDIIVPNSSRITNPKIYRFTANGELVWERDFNNPMIGGTISGVTLEDLNNDGILEIIISFSPKNENQSTLYVLDTLGNVIWSENFTGQLFRFGGHFTDCVNVVDLLGNGNKQLVFRTFDYTQTYSTSIRVFGSDGEPLIEEFYENEACTNCNTNIVSYRKEDQNIALFGVNFFGDSTAIDTVLYEIKEVGGELEINQLSEFGDFLINSLVVGEFEDDNILVYGIDYSGLNSRILIAIINEEGEIVRSEIFPNSSEFVGIPLLADINNDGISDIFFKGGHNSLFLDGNTLEVMDIPIVSYQIDWSSAIGDLNNNGHPETIVAGPLGIFVWELLDQTIEEEDLHWPVFQHDAQHTGFYFDWSCSDGTPYWECSLYQPLYCEEGDLIPDCGDCGCPSDFTCLESSGGCTYIPAIPLGDLDGNNIIDSYDASLVMQYFTGAINLEDWQTINADVDCNGIIESFDAALILQYVTELIDEFPCEGGRYNEDEVDILKSCIDKIKVSSDSKIVEEELMKCLSKK